MNTNGKLIEPNTLQFERLLPGPIERVWDYLTDPEKRGRWFASGPMELVAGGKVTFQFKHERLSKEADPVPAKYEAHAEGSESHATVVECHPPNKLTIEWEGLVVFELMPQDDQVKLTLTHHRLTDNREERIGVMAGWHTHLDILVDVINGVDAKGFWRVHMANEEMYDLLLEK